MLSSERDPTTDLFAKCFSVTQKITGLLLSNISPEGNPLLVSGRSGWSCYSGLIASDGQVARILPNVDGIRNVNLQGHSCFRIR
jgi:hypothetical protein